MGGDQRLCDSMFLQYEDWGIILEPDFILPPSHLRLLRNQPPSGLEVTRIDEESEQVRRIKGSFPPYQLSRNLTGVCFVHADERFFLVSFFYIKKPLVYEQTGTNTPHVASTRYDWLWTCLVLTVFAVSCYRLVISKLCSNSCDVYRRHSFLALTDRGERMLHLMHPLLVGNAASASQIMTMKKNLIH